MITDTGTDYRKLKNIHYLLAFLCGYVFPLAYFSIKLGITKETTSVVLPTALVMFLIVIKIGNDIPSWIATWEPSFKKGLIKASPKILLFVVLITFGLMLKYVIEREIEVAFLAYFETVLVLFGGMSVGSIFEAFHLKYKELYLMSKGYVLGTINK